MSWLARLKTGKTPEKDAAKTTETHFVVSVAPTLVPMQKNAGETVAANDPAPAPRPMAAMVDIGTVRPPGLSPLLLAASLALDVQILAAGQFRDSDENHDRWCYPSTAGMTGAEIDTYTARLARFTTKGVTHADAESLADRLVHRDRKNDSRRLCLDCTHLGGYGRASWRCGNWQAAGVAYRERDSKLPADLVLQLQRCDGFVSGLLNPLGATRLTGNVVALA